MAGDMKTGHYRLALIGFGNVGQALARLLERKRAWLETRYGITFTITAIATGSHGAAVDADGLDMQAALEIADADGMLTPLSKVNLPEDMLALIRACPADVLFENSPVSYHDGQPAVDHIQAALEKGMHAITANKGPVVHAHKRLTQLAEKAGRKFFFESTVMDGAPIFSLFRGALPAAELTSFQGILNSTTNMILTRMEQGEPFDRAVAYAQEIGVAESDPSGDVDGWDAAIKTAALASVLMGEQIKPADVERQGIRDLTPEDIRRAVEEGKRWKLLCRAERQADGLKVKVSPEMVPPESPFYHTEGTTSIVQFETDVLGRLTLIEENPGPETTAYGLLADFINAATG